MSDRIRYSVQVNAEEAEGIAAVESCYGFNRSQAIRFLVRQGMNLVNTNQGLEW